MALTQFQKSPVQRDYSCSFCMKTFGGSSLLSMHLKTHRGPKLFECPKCIKNFRQKRSFKAHLKAAHGEPAPSEHFKRKSRNLPKKKKKVAPISTRGKRGPKSSKKSKVSSNFFDEIVKIKVERGTFEVEEPEEDPLEVAGCSGSKLDPSKFLETELRVKEEIFQSNCSTAVFIKEEPIF
jgi:uncharacterized C2H2 Zn-finger protein